VQKNKLDCFTFISYLFFIETNFGLLVKKEKLATNKYVLFAIIRDGDIFGLLTKTNNKYSSIFNINGVSSSVTVRIIKSRKFTALFILVFQNFLHILAYFNLNQFLKHG